MKKIIISAFFLTLSTLSLAQESKDQSSMNEKHNMFYLLKVKLGYSQLKMDELTFNGNVSQIDFVLSNKLSKDFRIDYGVGFSRFNANSFFDGNPGTIENSYVRLPVNVIYSKNFAEKSSVVTGFGFYGSYLTKSQIPIYFYQHNLGLNFGASIQAGVKLNVTDYLDFGIMFESQADFTKIKKYDVSQRLVNTGLISFSFIYKM